MVHTHTPALAAVGIAELDLRALPEATVNVGGVALVRFEPSGSDARRRRRRRKRWRPGVPLAVTLQAELIRAGGNDRRPGGSHLFVSRKPCTRRKACPTLFGRDPLQNALQGLSNMPRRNPLTRVWPIVSWIAANWGLQLLAVAVGALTTYFAYLTKALRPYAPAVYVAFGLVAALLVGVTLWLIGVARGRLAYAAIVRRASETASANPLAGHFERLRLRALDFFHPFHNATHAARFEDCELLGPATVFFGGCQLLHTHFIGCQVVLVADKVSVVGVTAFESCTFNRCKLYQLTMMMTKGQYGNMLKAGLNIPVISVAPGP